MGTPGLTAIRDLDEARRVHVGDSLGALDAVTQFEGAIVDVGSGGGAPGIPLAAALPARRVVLLEAIQRKVLFLREWAREFPNVTVVHGRAEEQPGEEFGVAVAKALAPPVVAAEWMLPLVRVGGAAILFVGPTAEAERVQRAADQVGGGVVEKQRGLLVIPKVEPTPKRFPRRPGVARKRPLA